MLQLWNWCQSNGISRRNWLTKVGVLMLLGTVFQSQDAKAESLHFVDLKCIEAADVYGHDSLRLLETEATLPIWSTPRIRAGETRNLRNVPGVRFEGVVIFQLWEYDEITADDLLGECQIDAREARLGLREVTFNGDGGKYVLRYFVK